MKLEMIPLNKKIIINQSHKGYVMEHSLFFKGFALFLFFTVPVQAGLGLAENLVSQTSQSGVFPVVSSGQATSLCYDPNDYKGVIRAIGDLQMDIERVTDKMPQVSTNRPASGYVIIIGTLGKSDMIDGLVASRKLDTSNLNGKWESFVITTVTEPMPGIDHALVIAGSDKRGTIYGIYELSEQLGVSPWYWWADVPPKKHAEVYMFRVNRP